MTSELSKSCWHAEKPQENPVPRESLGSVAVPLCLDYTASGIVAADKEVIFALFLPRSTLSMRIATMNPCP